MGPFVQALEAFSAIRLPDAEFISIGELDHVTAHLRPDPVLPTVLRTLRRQSR